MGESSVNVLEKIENHMAAGLTDEQACELVDQERNPQDYYDTGFDEEREALIRSLEEEYRD